MRARPARRSRRRVGVAAVAAMGLVLPACGAEPLTGVTIDVRPDASLVLEAPEPTPPRGWVGPAGGRVGTVDGACRAIVPAGALAAETWVSFELMPDGRAWALTWLGAPLALPVVIQCQPPFGARPFGARTFGLRLEQVGFGANARARLPSPSLDDGWLTTWTWDEGVLRWTESSCSPRGSLGRLTCLADPRERCLRAPDAPLATACGFGCAVDGDCPAGLGCRAGRCGPTPCAGSETCRADEVCAGVDGVRFCLPRLPPRPCGACDPAEVCAATSSAADACARCGPRAVGCVGTSRACPLVTYDAFEGLDRSAAGIEDPTWSVGARLTDPAGTVVPFSGPAYTPRPCAPSFLGAGRLVTWEDARFAGALFSVNDCRDAQDRARPFPGPAQRGYSLFAVPAILDRLPQVGSAGESVVRWRAPRAGRVRVDLGLIPAAYEVDGSLFMAARLDHRARDGRRSVFGERRFVSRDPNRELRADVTLEVAEGDALELSLESTRGALVTRGPTYVDWQVTYLELSP